MFIKTSQFKKMLKELYKSVGIELFNTGEEIRIGGKAYWTIIVKKGRLTKENLAAVIEFAGELPKEGRGFDAAEDGTQESFLLQGYNGAFEDIENELYISCIGLKLGNNSDLRLLQDDEKNIYLIWEKALKLIDLKKLESDETAPIGPFTMPDGSIVWRNNTMALRINPVKMDGYKEILEALSGVPGGIA